MFFQEDQEALVTNMLHHLKYHIATMQKHGNTSWSHIRQRLWYFRLAYIYQFAIIIDFHEVHILLYLLFSLVNT